MCSITLCNPWTVACQAPLPMEFSRQEFWGGVPFPTLWDLPNSVIKPASLASPALAGGFFTTAPPGKPIYRVSECNAFSEKNTGRTSAQVDSKVVNWSKEMKLNRW